MDHTTKSRNDMIVNVNNGTNNSKHLEFSWFFLLRTNEQRRKWKNWVLESTTWWKIPKYVAALEGSSTTHAFGSVGPTNIKPPILRTDSPNTGTQTMKSRLGRRQTRYQLKLLNTKISDLNASVKQTKPNLVFIIAPRIPITIQLHDAGKIAKNVSKGTGSQRWTSFV